MLSHRRPLKTLIFLALLTITFHLHAQTGRTVVDFDKGWRFHLGDAPEAKTAAYADKNWRLLDLPHDWSIEGTFSKDNPAKAEGGALPGGIGWYRKTFTIPAGDKGKLIYIDFDGVYQKSEVWINGHHLGFRPNGYISFRYGLTPYLKIGGSNTIAVKVDNSVQPNSRWYSGSGIYRHVWLVKTNPVAVDLWGTYVTTPRVNNQEAEVKVSTRIRTIYPNAKFKAVTSVIDPQGKQVASAVSNDLKVMDSVSTLNQSFTIKTPQLWSVDHPSLYKATTRIYVNNQLVDTYTTPFGIRYFDFDADKGFSLNGKPLKILGVCDHHDLGSLGAAVNTRALERQLQILKAMGCNGIRTSHNPPAPELLDLCDKMGFIVMDEAFDCWRKQKVEYDYHLYFDKWHKRDLVDQLLRDRNHPSVMMWSIGNEIPEQGDSTGTAIARELAGIVRQYDNRPITDANDQPYAKNSIIRSGAVDLIGYNYHHRDYVKFHEIFLGAKFIGTETTSALETRGYYDMPSDSIRRWPAQWNKPFTNPNGNVVSAYDNVSAPWGSTHEETWKLIKKYDYLSGMYIWTGFDYLGEPTPYTWPSRSSYFGIIDLAGFPKDLYYMYQSEWTNKPVLHIFPHWNWQPGKTVDVWAYYNNADEVELFLNGKSLGIKKKQGDDLHVMWRLKFEPGTLKAVSRLNGKTVLTRTINTAGKPAKIELTADRSTIKADGKDLSFVTVKVLDKDGNLVPDAEDKLTFKLNGQAFIAGVDNGDPVSHDPFKASWRKAFHGLALAIIQAKYKPGVATLTATGAGLQTANLKIVMK
ncbi:beta-galactosidase GalB [Mucilaginibacter sp. KACC 22063]|uniref:beta-galactosidase GalB n=1 Tax=Mucilaginibacter sp. KACC 22063 TaxID=3025666 RepID=UPI002365EBD5|nr:beta-galactosidase GalB [Mucilaginibacter sp. KACC 22063]WDF54555.1 beta-galactosidase GalB [Mucilaginibacter sp. KACC 22063]